MSAFKASMERWRWWGIGLIVVIAASIILLPHYLGNWQIRALQLDKVQSVEYVEYEGEPFQSPIKTKKVLRLEKEQDILEQYLNIGKRYENTNKEFNDDCNTLLFFYHEDGNITNAYIKENSLGFHYGNKWFETVGLDNMIYNMEKVDIVEVKSNNI